MIDVATIEVMIEQMLEGDYSVYDTSKAIFEADTTKEEDEKIFRLFREAYKSIEFTNIADIQMSLALYSINADETMLKFYKWVSSRLDKVAQKKWTYKKFFQVWDKNYATIHIKLGDENLGIMVQGAIANIIYFINELREQVNE